MHTAAFQFIDPGPLVDGELELVAPDPVYVEEILRSCDHPLSRLEPACQTTRQQLVDFLRVAPQGLQRGDPERGRVPNYHFWMKLRRTPDCDAAPPVTMAGGVGLRIGNSPDLELYLGHIGYNVFPPARGRHLAERACRLLLPLARAHGMSTLWITCNPDNWPSRRTCERLGAELVGIVPLPRDHVLYQRGERNKCRYRIDL
jgi:tagatose 1,6-diphosphate aldolase